MSYDFVQNGWHAIDRGSINFTYGHIMFEYDDFRDLQKRLQRLARSRCMIFQLTWHRCLSQYGFEKSIITYCCYYNSLNRKIDLMQFTTAVTANGRLIA